MRALESLEAKGALPIRVYAMLSARDGELCRERLQKGPDEDNERMLITRSVKAYYDGALGSRGARLRHRIEHTQVVHPDDIPRFGELDVIASMEPPHCAEDQRWAEDRLGPERVKGAYPWRSLRKAGARLAFNSDLAGSDHDIFYGLHSASTRRGKDLRPEGGWYPEEKMTPEEALRGYTLWGAYAAGLESETGTLEPGKWADLTVMDIDPLVVGKTEPGKLFSGKIVATVVGGEVVHAADGLIDQGERTHVEN